VRVALFGSPAFALPVLESLYAHHQLVLVVTQPDKPAGRGLKVLSPAVAQRARALGLPLAQPTALRRNEAFAAQLRELQLDVAVTVAYGKILPASLLGIPRHGFLNVHASLLPKYRGAAPIQWALIGGETETGISIMQTDAGLDTGPVRLVRKLTIAPEDTALTLADKLATLGAEALLEALAQLAAGTLPSVPQDERLATLAPPLTKEDGRIRWEDPATAIVNRFRGVLGWPGSWTRYQGKLLKVHALAPVAGSGEAGTVQQVTPAGVIVAAGEGAVILGEVQPEGKARMPAAAWARGYGVATGVRLG
jgi:methionyl-tRNA formyltransferase